MTDIIKANGPSATGLRVEVRAKDNMASTLEQAIVVGGENIAGVKKIFGYQIKVKPVPLTHFLEFLDIEIKSSNSQKRLQGHA